ncbi:MAG: hypothetical protein MAG451_00322 [Anaerolineales bacterium]|nr:hypothetical protein [Anaerolineales bacterium]
MRESTANQDSVRHPLISILQSPISIFQSPFSILLLTLPAWLPLLLDPGLVNTRAGGDSPFLLQRVHQLSVALQGGHFPARWMPDAAYGHGYPFWNYYAPLAFYAAAGFHLAGLSIVNAIKLTQILGFLLAAAGMYKLADDIFDSRPAAVLAAAAYTYAPFHLVNVYVRGDSLGEFIAFAFYPLIFLGLRRLRSNPGSGPAAFTAAAYAGLVLAHNISALIFTPVALTYALLLTRNTQHATRKRYYLWTVATFALALILSAFYWAPALLEQDAVQLEGNLTGYFHYAGHFRSTNLVQADPLFNFDVDAAGAPFAMGLTQALLGFLGLLAITIAIIRRIPQFTIHSSQLTIHNSFFAATALIATFLITPWSKPLWDHIPLLPFVQFPWRWLSVQAFGLSLGIGALASSNLRFTSYVSRWSIAIILTLFLIATTMPSLNVEYLPVRDDDITAERLMLYEAFTGNIGSTVRAEYLPAAVVPRPWASAALTQGEPAPPIGADSAQLLSRGPASQQWRVTIDQQRDVIFPTYWFPGWRATIDGQPAGASAQPNHGGIRVSVPAGTHRIDLALGRTPIRLAAELASLVGVILLILLLTRGKLWRETGRGLVLIIAVVTALGIMLAARSVVGGAAGGPLVWDFSHKPYLHPDPEGLEFANGARLLDYEPDTTAVEAGQTFSIELTWQEPLANTEVEVALVSPAEILHHVPATAAEARNTQNAKRMSLSVLTNTTAGLYLPRLRLLDAGQRVPARVASGAEVGTVYLQPIRILPAATRRGETVGRFADLTSLGTVELRQSSARQVEVRMTWWPERPIAANYATSIRLKTPAGETIAQRDAQPCYGFCPTSTWEAGVPVHDRRWLEVPAGISAGDRYQVEVVLYERASLAAVDTVQVDVGLPSD